MRKFSFKSFAAGMIAAIILVSTATTFAATALKTIQVYPGTFKAIIIDGEDKTPPADKQPFLYNNTTYVPLRFIAENMYKNVKWIKETNSIVIDGISISDTDKAAIFNTLDSAFKHLQEEDMNACLDDLSASLDSSIVGSTYNTYKQVFAAYDVEYTIVSKEITAYNGNSCDVRIVSEARKVAGEYEYTDNRSTSIQKLVKENGEWKLTYSYIEKYELLN